MIQANELRIGNWVNFMEDDTKFQVTEITKSGIGVKNEQEETWIELDQFDPVRLTRQILEKCGWVWNGECNSFEKYPDGDVRMNISYNDVGGSWTMFNYVLKSTIAPRIYYLHQLQNLYFALTQTELQINL